MLLQGGGCGGVAPGHDPLCLCCCRVVGVAAELLGVTLDRVLEDYGSCQAAHFLAQEVCVYARVCVRQGGGAIGACP